MVSKQVSDARFGSVGVMVKSKVAPVRVKWPVEPQLVDLDSRGGSYAWVAFKLDSADWYLARLEELFNVVPRVEHQVGIERALDGVLESLCSAVDAACAAVIIAAEVKLGTKRPTPEHLYKPEKAVERLRQTGKASCGPTRKSTGRRGWKSNRLVRSAWALTE